MKLANYMGLSKEALIAKAFTHPVMKIRPKAAKTNPNIEDALKAVVNAIELAVYDSVADEITPILEDILMNQEIVDGTWEDSESQDEWESAVDDAVEAAIEPYISVLSADWLATHTIDANLHAKDGVKKFAAAMGREMFKQMTYELTAPKIMSAVGLTKADVEEALATYNQEGEKKMTDTADNVALADAVDRMLDYLGRNFDALTVYEDLELAVDDDELLSAGALARLGLEEDDMDTMQMVAIEHGTDAPDYLLELLKNSDARAALGGKPKKDATKKKAAPKPAKKAAKVEEPEEPDDEDETMYVMTSEILGRFKSACEFKDADIAQGLGVSRATFNNWVNGKTAPAMTDEQSAEVRDQIVRRANELLECLASIDGSEEPQALVA